MIVFIGDFGLCHWEIIFFSYRLSWYFLSLECPMESYSLTFYSLTKHEVIAYGLHLSV